MSDASPGFRFKGHTLRLMAALLVGLLVLLVGGVLGLALVTSLVAALCGAAFVWLAWLLIWRVYLRKFRTSS